MRRLAALLTVCALAAVAVKAPAFAQDNAPAGSTLEERTASALKTCFQCHGKGGVSQVPSRPSIAGQNASYIARQLMAFRRAGEQQAGDVDGDADDGPASPTIDTVRIDPVMEHLALDMSPGLIQSVARAVAQLPCASKTDQRQAPPKPPITARCDMCHGENGISTQPDIPNLAGQQRAYLRRQLLLIRETAYGAEPREGERWRSHPIMEREAARIAITDVDALARYYAAQDCKGAHGR